MAFSDMVDVEFMTGFLQITSDKFDETIDAAIPYYTFLIQRLTGVNFNELTDEDEINYAIGVLGFAIGCHIMKTDPAFGLKYQNWKVGNVQKGFFRRYASDFENWCDAYEEALQDLENILGINYQNSGARPGVSEMEDYSTPY